MVKQLRQSLPNLKAVVVPRHPERFDAVARQLSKSGLSWQRRSKFSPSSLNSSDVLLLDTMGELIDAYAIASVAVIGGSFEPVGGHNPIEAIKVGVPVIYGPHMKNFAQISNQLVSTGGALQAKTFKAAAPLVEKLLCQPELHEQVVSAGQQVVNQHKGATLRALAAIKHALEPVTVQDLETISINASENKPDPTLSLR
jgi:3-deoxy-D-manno-octulosonic-acid transferase